MKSTIIRTGFDTLYFTRLHTLLGRFFGGVGAILMLHHVRPQRQNAFAPNQGLEVSPAFLSHTVEWLRREGIDIVSLDEMHRRLTERDFGRRFACLTFDDGYRDNKQWAYPILKANQAPFAIYIPTSFPDRRAKLWWLALETVIADNASIVATVNGHEQRYDCVTPAQKRETFDAIYWWLRGIPHEAEPMHSAFAAAATDRIAYYNNKRQDLAFEKPVGNSADRRHHVRFWRVLERGQEGRAVWLGAATFDRGVGLSHDDGRVTHHIAPDIDAERDLLTGDLEPRKWCRLSTMSPASARPSTAATAKATSITPTAISRFRFWSMAAISAAERSPCSKTRRWWR